jgi:putative nucleotidyltransferase with HDIG domain
MIRAREDLLARGLTAQRGYKSFRPVQTNSMTTLAQPLRVTLDRVTAYAVGLSIAALATATALALFGFGLPSLWPIVALATVAAVAERGTVRLSTNSSIEESISLLPSLFAAVLFGPLAAMVVSAASMLLDVRGHPERAFLRWAVYTSTRSLTGAAVGLVAVGAIELTPSPFLGVAVAAIAGAIAAEVLDISFAALTFRVRGSGPMSEVVQTLAPAGAAAVPLYAPVVGVLAYAFLHFSPWTLPLFFIPALAAQRLFVMYQEQRLLTDGLSSANSRLTRANISFATALVTTLDARDQYTAGHSASVSVFARDIAHRMGLSDEECELARLAGLVHDIGKIGLPPGLLEKSGPLTLEERRQMEDHAIIGERILSKVDSYSEIAMVVRHHHERVDGNGYPDRLRGDEIPLIARIIAVADAYDAMTSDRPYREAMPSRVARLRLAQAVETHFDTSVVAAFEAILASANEAYRRGHRGDLPNGAQELQGRVQAARLLASAS